MRSAVLRRLPRPAACLVVACAAAVTPAAAPRPLVESPVPPAAGPGTLAVAAGLEATLFAGEPLLSSPSDIDVDAAGRVWVCEVLNYRGRKDTRPEGDRILVLEDTDGDGRADRRTVFHQGRDVDSALGICVIGEGPGRKVIVSCAPDVFVFHDDDGDLVADRRESLFTKTGMPQHDHSIHAFVVGPDGRWYFTVGNTGKAVHDRDGNPVKDRFGNLVNDSGRPYRQGMVFRCRPDGTDFEVLAHNFRNNYEAAVDSWGGLWQSDNDDDGNKAVRINQLLDYGNYGFAEERSGAGWRVPRTNIEAEVPARHWHQNDPGVAPNMLITGAGSPAGICVYEGSLLPARYAGAVIHCDAGPNVVRAYHPRRVGAGYAAEVEPLVDGSADRWFRPSDVCVAPDGSLLVADWYDPGVGGHGMGDIEKGRIYRIAPAGAKWSVPAVDVSTVPAAIAALASPNLCTRAMALERIGREPEAAAVALQRAFAAASDRRLRGRLAWAAGMLPGRADEWIARLVSDADEELRVVAVRLCRLAERDVVALVERCVDDPSSAVRREAAIALRGIAGDRADRAWAGLAARHRAGDRWELEALGIGADAVTGFGSAGEWPGRLAAWLERAGDGWRQPAGREIVWRSRGPRSAALIGELIADPEVGPAESLALVRGLDFQEPAAAAAVARDLIVRLPAGKPADVAAELAVRLVPADLADPAIARRIDELLDRLAGTQVFVDLVGRFALRGRVPALVALAGTAGTADALAAAAARTALAIDGGAEVRTAVRGGDHGVTARLLVAVGTSAAPQAEPLLVDLVGSGDSAAHVRSAAALALGRSKAGAERLVALARDGRLAGPLLQAAAAAVATCPWPDVKQSAAGVLPLPAPRGGGSLPSIGELVRHEGGDAARGKAVFAGVGTCGKCHVVGGEGRAVGPSLSGIGAKLSRSAIYEAILAPSAAISHGYETHTALLDDGRSITGLLVSQSPTEVVIRGADGIDAPIPAGDVEELVKQPISLMPADLATTLSVAELVDLVTWLETLRETN